MDAQLKAKWVEALRSGEYQQGKVALRREGKHCCLGVFCEVAGLTISEDGFNTVINGKERGYSAIRNFIPQGPIQTLYAKNDVGEPFSEIANYIEANL